MPSKRRLHPKRGLASLHFDCVVRFSDRLRNNTVAEGSQLPNHLVRGPCISCRRHHEGSVSRSTRLCSECSLRPPSQPSAPFLPRAAPLWSTSELRPPSPTRYFSSFSREERYQRFIDDYAVAEVLDQSLVRELDWRAARNEQSSSSSGLVESGLLAVARPKDPLPRLILNTLPLNSAFRASESSSSSSALPPRRNLDGSFTTGETRTRLGPALYAELRRLSTEVVYEPPERPQPRRPIPLVESDSSGDSDSPDALISDSDSDTAPWPRSRALPREPEPEPENQRE